MVMDAAARQRIMQTLGQVELRGHPYPGQKYHHGWIKVGAADMAQLQRSTAGKHDMVRAAEHGGEPVVPLQLGASGRTHDVLATFGDAEHLVTTHRGPDAERNAESDHLAGELARNAGIPAPRVLRILRDRSMSDLVDGPTWTERENQILADEVAYKRTPGSGDWRQKARHDLEIQRRDMLATPAAQRMGVLDLLTGTDVRDPGTVVLGPHGAVPVHTEAGWLNAGGRTTTHTPVARQPIPGIRLPKGMQLLDTSHTTSHPGTQPPRPTQAEAAKGLVTWSAFAQGGAWKNNPLTAADIAKLRAALDAARPDFEHRGRVDWWQFASDRLDQLAAHATGTVDLFA